MALQNLFLAPVRLLYKQQQKTNIDTVEVLTP